MNAPRITYERRVDPRKKTPDFEVRTVNADGSLLCCLGYFKWHAPWRCYTFHPSPNTLFDWTCLQKIELGLRTCNDEYKIVQRIRRQPRVRDGRADSSRNTFFDWKAIRKAMKELKIDANESQRSD